jgi:signal transduction histidine kinase/DNA-binding response OmpR family regulator
MPIFVSIKVKMLFTFLITFLFFTVLIGFWIFLSFSFLMDRVHTSQVEILQSVRNGIDAKDVLSLAQDGVTGELTADPRYIRIINWFDTVHKVKPTAWPYVFIPGKNKGEIFYIVDLKTKYTPDISKKFMQAETMDTSTDETLPGDIYFHVDEQGIRKSIHSIDMIPSGGIKSNGINPTTALEIFSQEMTTYGYIRDEQGNPIVGIGITDENFLVKDFNAQVIFFLTLSFIISLIIMLLIILRTGNIITNPIVRLTWAAEKINSGDNEVGLQLLSKSTHYKFSTDEISRLAETIKTQVSLQNALYTISEAANKTSDLHVLFEMTYKEVYELIRADDFVIALYNDDTKKVKIICASCPDTDFQFNNKEYSINTPPDLTGYVIQTGQPLLLNMREYKKMLASKLIVDTSAPIAWLGVPLQTTGQKTFGALVAQSYTKGTRFTPGDQAFLSFIASQLVMIVNRSKTENELRQSYQLLELRVRDRTSDLQEANLQLEREIGERERAEIEMLQAKDAAEAANIAKSAFLANMSHELRTPLNAILGFSGLMAHDPNFPLQQKEDLGIILQSGEHLLDLINDVLDMSKIESGRMILNPNSFDLHQLLNDTEEVFQVRAAEKGLSLVHELSTDLPKYISTDEKKLRQVIYNLLSNGVKFTQSGGLTLRSRLIEQLSPQKVHLGFEIEDTGPGISPDQIKDLFNYFVQTDTGKKSLEGTGLGLSISKNFIRMMDGDIHVTSEVGKGSIFAFDIFAELSSSEAIQVKTRERRAIGLEPGQRSWRILIAEDREANRKLLVRLLQPFTSQDGKPGFEIREAVNGREALEVWEAWSPDLIFMDMRMPEMNGHEATQRIRASVNGHATKIIALTASAFEEERQLILSEGIDDFIRKPFKEYEIFNVLSKHLESVNFIYSEEDPGKPAESMNPEQKFTLAFSQIRDLPTRWQQDLTHAAAAADSERIYELLRELNQDHPQLVNFIESLVTQYRFDLISQLIQEEI